MVLGVKCKYVQLVSYAQVRAIKRKLLSLHGLSLRAEVFGFDPGGMVERTGVSHLWGE